VKTFTYDPIGNLLSKSDVGTYTYPLAGSALPHAVSVINGTINSTFTYDGNGNQTAGVGRGISYTSYNKPSSITQGSATLFFSDDIDHQRFKQQAPEGTTYYCGTYRDHTICPETNFLQISGVYDGASQLCQCGGTAVSSRACVFLVREPNCK
jgi:hypothetical protein